MTHVIAGFSQYLSVFRDPVTENSGRYTCSVVNEVGAAMAMSHVTIIPSDNIGVNMSQQVKFL